MDLTGKKVLVTGASGFLGTHVVMQLNKTRAEAIPLLHKNYDLNDKDTARWLFLNTKPHIVIHLAALCGGIGANRERPADFLYTNLNIGINVMKAALDNGVSKFVNISTVCSYPKYCPVPFKEENIWNGYPEETNAPYGIAKKTLMLLGQCYKKQYGFNCITVIPVNLYGPNDHFDSKKSHVIPALIRKCLKAKDNGESSITLWGDGTPSREFLYVEDAAKGIILATMNYDEMNPVNLGTGQEIRIWDLAALIADITGFEGEIIWDWNKPNGQPRRCLDVSKAKEFGFEAKTSLVDGLKKTVEWYLTHRSK